MKNLLHIPPFVGGLAVSAFIALNGCAVGYSEEEDDDDPTEVVSDTGATVEDDTAEEEEDDTGEDDTGEEEEAVETDTIIVSLILSAGACEDMIVSLTQVTYMGEYFDYEDLVATEAVDADCAATFAVADLSLSSMSTISDDLGDLSWAVLLPAVYTATGAPLQIQHSASPAHDSGTFEPLEEGDAYVGISDTLLAYIEGDLNTLADNIGLEEGWDIFERSTGDRALSLIGDDHENVISVGETIEIAMTDNLRAADTEMSLAGDEDQDDDFTFAFAPYPWFADDTSSTIFSGQWSIDGNDWELAVSDYPEADHYLPTTAEDADTVFDTCCRDEIPVAVEVPVTYVDDGDSAFTASDTQDGSMCREGFAAVLIHYAEPTHLWAAEWYHLNDEQPGWRVKYEYSETAWKTLEDDDTDSLNMDDDCVISDNFTDAD